MTSAEERRKILEMLAEGKINTAEAAALLGDSRAGNAEESKASSVAVEQKTPAAKEPGRGPQWLHIRVSDLESGRSRVAVNIPLQLVKIGAQLGSGFVPEFERIDWELLSSSLAGSEGRPLVDVRDEEDGDHVQIYVD